MAAKEAFCEELGFDIELMKDGREVVRGQQSRLRTLSYGRVTSAVSTATVEIFVPSRECAGSLAVADYDNTTLTITEGTNEAWYGRVSAVEYSIDSVVIEAEDLLSWLNRRLLRTDLIYTTPEAIELIALEIYNQVVMSVDPPEVVLHTYLSGIAEARQMLGSQNRYGWSIISEMLETGLDVTTFGRQILFGLPNFGKPINMTDQDVIGDVRVRKDGADAGNFVVVDAQNDTAATYPPVRERTNGYPVVDVVISDGQITDATSAASAAKARYDWSARGVRRVKASGGLVLSPNSKIDARKLIAGQPINFTATQTCYTATETLRLGSVQTQVAAGVRQDTIDLQPLGSYQQVGQ